MYIFSVIVYFSLCCISYLFALYRCRRPNSQQPSVVLLWDRLLMVAGVCNDTIQYPLTTGLTIKKADQ